MMMGRIVTPWVEVGVDGTRVGVEGIRVGGTEVGTKGNKVGSPDELLSWQPVTPNQNKNKSTAMFFNGWMVFKIFKVFTLL